MRKVATVLAGLVIAVSAAGCSTWDGMSKQEKSAVVGAGVGGVVGGAATGGGVLGTVGGAAVGGVIGNEVGKRR